MTFNNPEMRTYIYIYSAFFVTVRAGTAYRKI